MCVYLRVVLGGLRCLCGPGCVGVNTRAASLRVVRVHLVECVSLSLGACVCSGMSVGLCLHACAQDRVRAQVSLFFHVHK